MCDHASRTHAKEHALLSFDREQERSDRRWYSVLAKETEAIEESVWDARARFLGPLSSARENTTEVRKRAGPDPSLAEYLIPLGFFRQSICWGSMRFDFLLLLLLLSSSSSRDRVGFAVEPVRRMPVRSEWQQKGEGSTGVSTTRKKVIEAGARTQAKRSSVRACVRCVQSHLS
jgi:hypothetical protein